MKRILFGIFAHPDDEGFGPSGTLIKEVKRGTELHLICATQGEAGNNPDHHADLGSVRKAEWRKSCELIGATDCIQLGYPDSKLSTSLYLEIVDKIQAKITEVLEAQPEPIDLQFMTFDSTGLSGHIDHITMSMISSYIYYSYKQNLPDHVAKIGLRYFCIPKSAMPEPNTDWLYMPAGRPDDQINEIIDVSDVFDKKLEVMAAHHTQRDDAAMIRESRGEGLKQEHFYYAD